MATMSGERPAQVRAYLTPEENAAVTDDDIRDAMGLLDALPWSPVGVARVMRSALRKGW